MNGQLLTSLQRQRLLDNWRANASAGGDAADFTPVVKLFTPDAGATWLLSELNPADEDTLFGLCDLGQGLPELGYVSLTELKTVRGKWGLPIERDLHFKATRTLNEYAELARQAGRIVA